MRKKTPKALRVGGEETLYAYQKRKPRRIETPPSEEKIWDGLNIDGINISVRRDNSPSFKTYNLRRGNDWTSHEWRKAK